MNFGSPRRFARFLALPAVVLGFLSPLKAAPPSRPVRTPEQQQEAAKNPLRYHFKGAKSIVYEVIIQGEMPKDVLTKAGYIVYYVESVDEASGQITFRCAQSFNDSRQPKPTAGQPLQSVAVQLPHSSFSFTDPPRTDAMVIDGRGNTVRWKYSNQDPMLPHMLGLAWQLMLEPLSEGDQEIWGFERNTSFWEVIEKNSKPTSGYHRQPQPQPEYVQHSAKEKMAFAILDQRGNLVTVKREYEMQTDEKQGDVPLMTNRGEGKFVFDKGAGLIQSMDMKTVIRWEMDNISVKLPVSVRARLVSDDEFAKLEEAHNKAVDEERSQKLAQAPKSITSKTLPAGATKTELLGGSMGSEFIKVDPMNRRMIGLKIAKSQWGGKFVFGQIEPLFEPAENSETTAVAKEGYAVGGMTVSSTEFSNAAKLTFMKVKDGKLDKNDSYQSEWIGNPEGGAEKQLGGTGQNVIGIHGKNGMNIHGVGLVLTSADPSKPKALTAAELARFKTIEAGWQANTGKSVDLLPTMIGSGVLGPDGIYTLGGRQRMESVGRFKVPVTFRAVVLTTNDIRFGYAADQIIFNWDGNRSELRIDGGPANGQHKPGAGQLPNGTWTGIEMVVLPDELVFYVDGKERYRAKGNFSNLNKPFTFTSQHENTRIKSLVAVQ